MLFQFKSIFFNCFPGSPGGPWSLGPSWGSPGSFLRTKARRAQFWSLPLVSKVALRGVTSRLHVFILVSSDPLARVLAQAFGSRQASIQEQYLKWRSFYYFLLFLQQQHETVGAFSNSSSDVPQRARSLASSAETSNTFGSQ